MRTQVDIEEARLRLFQAHALDVPDQADMAARIAGDTYLQARLAGIAMVPPLELEPWRVPPPRGGLSVRMPAVLSAPTPRIGERFSLPVPADADPEQHLVILRRVETEWSVVYPQTPGDVTQVAQMPEAIDLVATAPAGRQRWAIALVDRIEWPAPWGPIQVAVAQGEARCESVDIEVAPAV